MARRTTKRMYPRRRTTIQYNPLPHEILYSNGAYTVRRATFGKTNGFAVYQDTATASVKVASIGYSGDVGLTKAIQEADRRANAHTNPAPAAAALYESWTGEPSTHETVVTETVYDHGHLTDLARLVAFKLRGIRGQLKFTDRATRLCSNETGTQLYIRGGDQAINLDDFNTLTRRPVDPTKESIVLGEIEYLYYSARKPFLGREHTKTGVYKHKLGEETGNRPVLIYDTRSQLLSISGGAYYIKPGDYDGKHSRGIVD